MNNKQKLAKAIKLVEEGNIPDYFEFMQSEVGENGTSEVDKKANLSLLQNTVIEGKESVAFANRLILLARTFFDEQATKDRKDLLEGLANRYEKRLNKKLEETLFQNIEVDLEYTTEGTSKKHVETYFIEKEAKPTGDFEKLFSRYLNELKSLLILGNAGSGKTVLLLKIGKELVKLAKKDALYPLPVLVNLASWRNEEQDFKTWLASVLVFSAGESEISKDYAKELAAENNLLLLLDGLDEIPEAHRNSCLEAFKQYAIEINNNRADYPEWVICSRKNEYKQIEKDAFVKASVLFKPLTDEKIQTTLHILAKDKNMAAQALLTKIAANSDITEHFRTAFEFHLALKMANDDNFRADNLIADFIDKELKEITPDYPKAKHYLSFLAKKMKETKKGITFELADMQPSWLREKILFIYVVRLTFTTLYSFSLSILYSFFIASFFWCISMLLGEIIDKVEKKLDKTGNRFNRMIAPQEIMILNTNKYNFNKIKIVIIIRLLVSVTLYLICLPMLIISKEHDTFLYLIVIFTINLIFIEIFYIPKRNIIIEKSYKRLYSPLFFNFLQWIFPIFIFLYTCTSINKNIYSLYLIICVFVATTLNNVFCEHFILRFLLFLETKIPLRYRTFLNKVSQTGILEKDGGQWRFRHQLLQDALVSSS